MTIKFKPIPRQNITPSQDEHNWNISGLPAHLELQPQQFPLPTGWVLLRGVLHRSGQDYSARLIAEVGGVDQPYHYFPLPVSRKGIILELIYLPKGVLRLVLEPMQSHGQFQLVEIAIKPVNHVERIGKMVNRVAPLFFKYSYQQRHRSGLKLHTPLTNLPKAYQIAGRFRAYATSLSYKQWIEEFDVLTHRDRRLIHRQIKKWRNPPHFEIIINVDVLNEVQLRHTLDSLHRQLFHRFRAILWLSAQEQIPELSYHPHWLEICKADTKSNLANLSSAQDSNVWTIFLHPGVVLADHTLYWLAHEALMHEHAGFIYADHDVISAEGKRIDPAFKPDWSSELLRSSNYIHCAAAVRSDILAKVGGLSCTDAQFPDYHDLFLRVTEQLQAEAIRHIPAVLWHVPLLPETIQASPQSQTNPVMAHLQRLGIAATVERISAEHFRVRYDLPEQPPKISIIIPTRDELEHLRACVESVLNLSRYKNFEVLIVDNQSTDPDTLKYLKKLKKRPRVRILPYPQDFNYSAINNFAALEAQGEVLCLLNNDTEVITPNWLEEMLGHLLQPSVGVVGAKLYFSDGRVQHAGDTVGPGGCAHHLHSLIAHDAPGYCNRAILAQEFSAVTAACLMTWRKLFLELGGLDEQNLPVSFNDVDYCLRVRAAGYRVLWTPYAELYHHESVSRGKDNTPEKIERSRNEANYMRKRWKHLMLHDPFYNPNLSYERPDFSLSNAPLVKRPW